MATCHRPKGLSERASVKVTVIDYGMGNLRSVAKALESAAPAGTRVCVSADPADIHDADRVVLPGQGAAAACVAAIDGCGLRSPILAAIDAKPFLGICMGLQVLFDHSAENGGVDCLGVVPGVVSAFPAGVADPDTGESLTVPAMGWNRVAQRPHPLWDGIDNRSHFYFAHSYVTQPADAAITVGESVYGAAFTSAIARDNLFACQFHPEKSATQGLKLLGNFLRWTVSAGVRDAIDTGD
ncbi:MAG: imidazole glycerol phosphate synthase subunit HisH [Pseudomonadota bacterium]